MGVFQTVSPAFFSRQIIWKWAIALLQNYTCFRSNDILESRDTVIRYWINELSILNLQIFPVVRDLLLIAVAKKFQKWHMLEDYFLHLMQDHFEVKSIKLTRKECRKYPKTSFFSNYFQFHQEARIQRIGKVNKINLHKIGPVSQVLS